MPNDHGDEEQRGGAAALAQRPTIGLVDALKAELAEICDDGRTKEEQIAHVLVQEALFGKHRLAAIQMILDRVEGKPRQSIEVTDPDDEFEGKTMEELKYYVNHNGVFPTKKEGSGA